MSRRLPPLARRVAAAGVAWTVHLVVCYRAEIQPHREPLARRSIMTEWTRWGGQVYTDTGMKLLVRSVRAAR